MNYLNSTPTVPEDPSDTTPAPFLLRYGLWLTAFVYAFAALTVEESPLGPVLLFQFLYLSIAASALGTWFRPDLAYVRRYHVAVPTALIIISGSEQVVVLLDAVTADGGLGLVAALAGFLGTVYIGVVQYVFLPLSILHKSGPT